jgi:sec-independent protein translocase protein TatC
MLEEIKPHIAELRSRLIKIVISFFILFILAFVVWKDIFLWIAKPAFEAMKGTSSSEMIFTNLVEPFMTAIKISLYTAFFASLPVILYHTWKFIAPGLYDHEKKLVIPFVLFGTIMFIVGAAFAYYIVFPIGFKVMINFGGKDFVAMLKISEYVSVALKIMIGFGIAFELPVVTYFLAKLGLVTDKTLKDFARYAIVIIFIVAAVLTPPDLFSQLAMAAPLLLLYGLSILIAKAVNPEKEEN